VLALLAVSFILFIIFLTIRELVCWYYKINRIVELLEQIQSALVGLISAVPQAAGQAIELVQGKEICPFCNEPTMRSNPVCEVCGKMKR
jgi:hypothetical protein